MYQSHNVIVKTEQTGELQLGKLSYEKGGPFFQGRQIKVAVNKTESVSCRIK